MKELPHFDSNDPANLPSRKERHARFLKQQPDLLKFVADQGVTFKIAGMAILAKGYAFGFWEHFDAAMDAVPTLPRQNLDRHYEANRSFVAESAGPARDQGFQQLVEVIKPRPQWTIRLFALCSLFDFTQGPMIGPEDKTEAPDLVHDQNHMHTIMGAVLETLNEFWEADAANHAPKK